MKLITLQVGRMEEVLHVMNVRDNQRENYLFKILKYLYNIPEMAYSDHQYYGKESKLEKLCECCMKSCLFFLCT